MGTETVKSVAVIVAHPDDETLWAGGTILNHPYWQCFVVSLCRGKDKKRAPKFFKTLKLLQSEGIMGNLNDGPEQKPLSEREVQHTILDLLPPKHYDLIISHSPTGEYTKHLRHEEVGNAVIALWQMGKISADELWVFAYEDDNKAHFPKAIENGTIYHTLTEAVWLKKYAIITQTYGFKKDSWEAQTTPQAEAFRQFRHWVDAVKWFGSR